MMIEIEKLIKILSEERLKPYLTSSKNKEEAILLYEFNINISEEFYTPLNFLEIVLRNKCNEKLRKEVGEEWYLNSGLFCGGNSKKGQWAIEQIEEAIKKNKNRKKEKSIKEYSVTLDDIVSNLQFSFWSNLFIDNYANNLWQPYLKFIFSDFERKELCKQFIISKTFKK